MRIRLDLAYDGTDFHGWASQRDQRTVQGDVEAALATALRVDEVALTCAGRTDAGVHARGQVAHLDVADTMLADSAGRSPAPPLESLLRRVNGLLEPDVRVLRISEVPDAFDARFAALWRRYSYRVADRPAYADPLTRHHVLVWPRPLDVGAMDEAAQSLVGFHDFASFCKAREGATTIRTLTELTCRRREDGVVETRVVADAFCHHMVRSLMGCLVTVGEGRRPVAWAAQVLEARQREGFLMVPAHGLTLEEVGYPADSDLARRAAQTKARRDE